MGRIVVGGDQPGSARTAVAALAMVSKSKLRCQPTITLSGSVRCDEAPGLRCLEQPRLADRPGRSIPLRCRCGGLCSGDELVGLASIPARASLATSSAIDGAELLVANSTPRPASLRSATALPTPSQRFAGQPDDAVEIDDGCRSIRSSPSRLGRHDHHRAARVVDAVHPDRAEQDAADVAVATAADDQEVGICAELDEDIGGMPELDILDDVDALGNRRQRRAPHRSSRCRRPRGRSR